MPKKWTIEQQMDKLVAASHAIAKLQPFRELQDDPYCFFCDSRGEGEDYKYMLVGHHSKDCPWVALREVFEMEGQ